MKRADNRFLPTSLEELKHRNWDQLDVILVSGDSYIDSPFIGAAVIGRVLEQAGFRVGIIAQPDILSPDDITRLGEPRLFWGVTGGSVDSMVANYTAVKKHRKSDDYTPGGMNNRRPDRAVIAYTNLIRRFFKNTRPILLGGIEASLRRIAHYDYWSDSLRRSILFDAKADYLLYGMAEQSVLDFARAVDRGEEIRDIRGLCYISRELPDGDYLELPAYEEVAADKQMFIRMYHAFYHNTDPLTARRLVQRHADRLLIHNPPSFYLSQAQLDAFADLPYQRLQHPYYEKMGSVKALETIQFSINIHRGCYGECNFCAIAVHEGRTVRWRSLESIKKEAEEFVRHPDFKGIIQDIGGPTANMYGYECHKKLSRGVCEDKRCLFPEKCVVLKPDHAMQIELLKMIRSIPGVRKVFVASGIRPDLIQADEAHGEAYLREIVSHHVSGQLKIAPEHSEESVLALMGKPGSRSLLRFKREFDSLTASVGKHQFLTYYLIAAHPGCDEENMRRLKRFTSRELHISPEQVQIFTPTPSTYSSLMYYTEMDPFSMNPIFVEKENARKERQKAIITGDSKKVISSPGTNRRIKRPGRP
ncbi:MAG: YgiQ family radical SAM protein [Leptolinea sp.]|nr:YgiQ family radical SAM protein [Leptolinea sp.]